MNEITLLLVAIVSILFGSVLGYYARQSLAKRNYETIEARIERRVERARANSVAILNQAKEKASQVLEEAKKETDFRNLELLKRERFLLKRENLIDKKLTDHEAKETDFQNKVEKLKEIKQSIEHLKQEAEDKLESIAGLNKEQAKKDIFDRTEKEYEQEILEKIRRLEEEGEDRYETKAKEILSLAIQRFSIAQSQDITTTTVALPSDEIKGRIIGKEGRNIKTLERLTGVEVIVDETPEAVVISGFDPTRRQIAKVALEKLIKDGRIHPARIEEFVKAAESEVALAIKKYGEAAVYETGILGLDPKLITLLGRLHFRTSYGQSVLLHSIEVSHLAGVLAAEVGANVSICRKAGLLHDIGKALDHQVEGSHVEIGIKILEKLGEEKNVILAMRSHHEEYPYETLESILVQSADAISGSRPGARKDTLENYLKRLGDLENIANAFSGVEKSYAISAGREIRVFVTPDKIDDLGAQKLARDVAKRIEEELKYPGEIKVTVIRENRVTEYAK